MPRKADTSFMQYVRAVWAGRFPGTNPPGYAARALRGVYSALGDEEATNRLRRYLARSEAKYVNLWNFASTHSDYANETPKGPKREGSGQPLSKAIELYRSPEIKPEKKTTPTETIEVEVDPSTGRYRPKS